MENQTRRRIILVCLILVHFLLLLEIKKTPEHDSALDGESYFKELMESPNVNRWINVGRMPKQTFELLHAKLKEFGLRDSRSISSGQKILILISILTGNSYRQTAERWQHSIATISEIVHEVSQIIVQNQGFFLRSKSHGDPVQIEILHNRKFYPYFKNCIGALDGTHISAIIPVQDQGPFRNRKGSLSQNVLCVVDFDLIITFVLVGWEGSAQDSRVLSDAISKGLAVFPDKYYLGDAGYGLSEYCLTPYRGVRYHLKEWRHSNRRPQNKEELFNLRHSSLRNVIERLFGVLKKRFPLLRDMHSFPFNIQCDLVLCICYLNNFIRFQQIPDYFDELQDELEDRNERDNLEQREQSQDDTEMKRKRNIIAQQMWDDFH